MNEMNQTIVRALVGFFVGTILTAAVSTEFPVVLTGAVIFAAIGAIGANLSLSMPYWQGKYKAELSSGEFVDVTFAHFASESGDYFLFINETNNESWCEDFTPTPLCGVTSKHHILNVTFKRDIK